MAISSAKQLRIVAALVLLFVVWSYARFAGPHLPPAPPEFVVGSFARALPFTATPAGNLAHINARYGPGTEYSVQRQFDRGTLLNGIARRSDQNGAYWIELAGGQGFVKESVLVATEGGP